MDARVRAVAALSPVGVVFDPESSRDHASGDLGG